MSRYGTAEIACQQNGPEYGGPGCLLCGVQGIG